MSTVLILIEKCRIVTSRPLSENKDFARDFASQIA